LCVFYLCQGSFPDTIIQTVGAGLARPAPMQLFEYIENNLANWKENCFYANAVRA
jgi:hypothetical protein